MNNLKLKYLENHIYEDENKYLFDKLSLCKLRNHILRSIIKIENSNEFLDERTFL